MILKQYVHSYFSILYKSSYSAFNYFKILKSVGIFQLLYKFYYFITGIN